MELVVQLEQDLRQCFYENEPTLILNVQEDDWLRVGREFPYRRTAPSMHRQGQHFTFLT
jgi:hypothetical protein